MPRTSASASDSQKRLMLRAVRGSPSTIILAMILFPNLHGESGLASASGLDRKTVRKCLYDLEGLGFVLRGGRYRAWVLAPGVRQMVLGEDGREGYILPIAGSSSSTCIDAVGVLKETETTTTRADGEGEGLPFAAELERCLGILLEMGCSPAMAEAGLGRAIEGGAEAGEIETRLAGWRGYCASEMGRSVRAPGFLTAKRVGQGVDAPELAAETRDAVAAHYLDEAMGWIVKH